MNTPPTVPLSQFAQAAVAGWELHCIGGKFYVLRRSQGERVSDPRGTMAAPLRLRPFPGCESELPTVARRLFIEVHTDIKAGRNTVTA